MVENEIKGSSDKDDLFKQLGEIDPPSYPPSSEIAGYMYEKAAAPQGVLGAQHGQIQMLGQPQAESERMSHLLGGAPKPREDREQSTSNTGAAPILEQKPLMNLSQSKIQSLDVLHPPHYSQPEHITHPQLKAKDISTSQLLPLKKPRNPKLLDTRFKTTVFLDFFFFHSGFLM
jgi:hypothetical protein